MSGRASLALPLAACLAVAPLGPAFAQNARAPGWARGRAARAASTSSTPIGASWRRLPGPASMPAMLPVIGPARRLRSPAPAAHLQNRDAPVAMEGHHPEDSGVRPIGRGLERSLASIGAALTPMRDARDADASRAGAELFDLAAPGLFYLPGTPPRAPDAAPTGPGAPGEGLLGSINRPVLLRPGIDGWIAAADFSPDGRRLAAAYQDGTVILWDTASGGRLHAFATRVRGSSSAFSWSPDGNKIVLADHGGRVALLDTRAKKALRSAKVSHWVHSIAWGPDSSRFVTLNRDHATLWNGADGARIEVLRHHGYFPGAAAFSRDGKLLATLTDDNAAVLWNPANGKRRVTLRGHSDIVAAVAFSPDGKLAATASRDRTAAIWDVRTGERLHELKGHTDRVTGLAFSPSGKSLATAGRGGDARIWNVDTGADLHMLQGHTGWVHDIAWSPDDRWLATLGRNRAGEYGKELILWDAGTGKLAHRLDGYVGIMMFPAFTPDSGLLATSDRSDMKAIFWDVETGRPVRTFHGSFHLDADRPPWSPDLARVVLGKDARTLQLWKVQPDRAEIASLERGLGSPAQNADPKGAEGGSGGASPYKVRWDHALLAGFASRGGRTPGNRRGMPPSPAPNGGQGDPASRDLLDALLAKQGIPKDKRPEFRRKVAELWQILSGFGSAVGGEQRIRFKIGRWWQTDTETRTIYIPILEILKHLDNIPALAGGILHEAGHVFYTRFHDLPMYEKLLRESPFPEAVHTFFNVLEDMFQEHAKSQRWPGAGLYLKTLHSVYRPDLFTGDLSLPKQVASSRRRDCEPMERVKRMFPHEEYLDALRSYWMTRKFPAAKDMINPEVARAVRDTKKAVDKLLTLLPESRVPSEDEKVRSAYKRFKHIERAILPHYLKLLEISKDRLGQAMQGQDGQQGRPQQGGGWSGQGKRSGEAQKHGGNGAQGDRSDQHGAGGGRSGRDERAERSIESRAAEIGKRLAPTHGDDERRNEDKDSVDLDPSRRPGDRDAHAGGPKPGEDAERPDKGEDADPPKDGERSGGTSGSAEKGNADAGERPSPERTSPPGSTASPGNDGRLDVKEIVQRLIERHEQSMRLSEPSDDYEHILLRVHHLIDPLVGRLENIFAKNERDVWADGRFRTGQKVDVKKWIRSKLRGWRNPGDFKVFMRRRLPTRRDYKFSLLIDLSGSMGGENMEHALETAVLFIEVLDRLGIDYSVLGFSEKVYAFKRFWDGAGFKPLTHDEKRGLIGSIRSSGGGSTHDAEAVHTAIRGNPRRNIAGLEQQPGERRVLMVMTDGEGNGAASAKMGGILARAARKLIEVIGIGVGEGMAYVKERYPKHVLEADMELVPGKIGDILEEQVQAGFDEGVPDLEDEEGPDALDEP